MTDMTELGYTKIEQLKGLIEQLSAYIATVPWGEVEFVSFDGKIVKVRMGGACVGCRILRLRSKVGWRDPYASSSPRLKA